VSTAVEVFDRLLHIALLIQEDLARSFAATNLTVARTHLLWELHRLGPSTQNMLAATLKVSPRNVTGLVDALEAAGYVVRAPHPKDRRALLVTLTDQGSQTMAQMEHERGQIAAELVADLDADQLQQLSQGLGTIVARLQGLMETAGSSNRKRTA
jgi:DNA-binding MarR family transcriptional regulator